ncbi:allophanate hydrolase subunit 1 [Nautilia sp. PV-1]|nr:allophanate hydrolase subunit 1 [Nautilia sp. PV-1]
MKFKQAGIDSLLIEFGIAIDQDLHKIVILNSEILKPYFLEVTVSYTTILVKYGIDQTFEATVEKIKEMLVFNGEFNVNKGKIITIGAYYGEETGFDLKRVAYYHKTSVKNIIKIHSSKIYHVYALGFLPGFAYMAATDIYLPMKKNFINVPKGSIGVAGVQTGIYPLESLSGWNIIARTYEKLFDENIDGFSLLKVGDRVKFEPVTKEEFINRGGQIEGD